MKIQMLELLSKMYEKCMKKDEDIENIFYIGGSENLPAPLEAEEEAMAIKKLANGDEEAKKLLVEHNLRLVVYIAKKFENTGIGIEDLISIGTIGLIKAVNTFNFDATNKLATYASRCIENEILMYIRNNKKRKDTISLYAPIGEDKDGNEIKLCDVIEDPSPSISERIVEDEQNKLIQEAVNKLTGREYEIICRRFGLNGFQAETQREIAKSMGISRSYVSRIEKRVLTKLYLNLKEHN
mgnify:CR=1 FL=1